MSQAYEAILKLMGHCTNCTNGCLQSIDTMTPLARGCSMLLAGSEPEEQSRTLLSILANQVNTPVQVIYAATEVTQETIAARVGQLRGSGVMTQATVVVAGEGAPLGEQYATLCTAISLGEHVRNHGGHALVALDSMECVVKLWDSVTREVERTKVTPHGVPRAFLRLQRRYHHTPHRKSIPVRMRLWLCLPRVGGV
jgi:flagellar biosynthesis/type III secretory pathway ATPase